MVYFSSAPLTHRKVGRAFVKVGVGMVLFRWQVGMHSLALEELVSQGQKSSVVSCIGILLYRSSSIRRKGLI